MFTFLNVEEEIEYSESVELSCFTHFLNVLIYLLKRIAKGYKKFKEYGFCVWEIGRSCEAAGRVGFVSSAIKDHKLKYTVHPNSQDELLFMICVSQVKVNHVKFAFTWET